MSDVLAIVFHTPFGSSRLEQLVGRARRAAAEDLIARLEAAVSHVVVATPREEDAAAFRNVGAEVLKTAADGSFDFGHTLAAILRTTKAQSVLSFGSGSGALLERRHIESLAEFARQSSPAALLNNFYSCDFVALAGAQTLLDIRLPAVDNGLGFVLADAGIRCFAMPRDAASQFDIDLPTDLCLLNQGDRGGPALRRVLDDWLMTHPTLEALSRLLTDRSALVEIGGRIHPGMWQAFEQATACRTAGFAEGRGLKGYPDGRNPLVQSLIGDDPSLFFERLAAAADGAILDTRPLLGIGGVLPPPQDRFASDLFLVDEVSDPRWRAFTEAAEKATIPVILGGHNLVSGGLLLLAEHCWKGRDLPRRLHPESFRWKEESS